MGVAVHVDLALRHARTIACHLQDNGHSAAASLNRADAAGVRQGPLAFAKREALAESATPVVG